MGESILIFSILLLVPFPVSNNGRASAFTVSTKQSEHSTLPTTSTQTTLNEGTDIEWNSSATNEGLTIYGSSDFPKTLNTGSSETMNNKPSQKPTTRRDRTFAWPGPGRPQPPGTTEEQSEDSPINGTNECIRDLLQYRSDLQKRKLYALKMYDSRGKLSSGILLNYMIRWLGQYDECLKISTRAEDNRGEPAPFNGRYCLIDIKIDFGYLLEPQNNTKNMVDKTKSMSKNPAKEYFKRLANYQKRRGKNVEKMTTFQWTSQEDSLLSTTESPKFWENFEDLPEINLLSIGVCIPDSCNSKHFPDLASREYLCDDSCESINGICEDRLGEGQYLRPKCEYGTDCEDCGERPAIGDQDILGLLPNLPAALFPGSPTSVKDIFGVVTHCTDDEKQLSTGAIVMLSIIGILVLLVVIGSVYDCCRDCKLLKRCKGNRPNVENFSNDQTFEMLHPCSLSDKLGKPKEIADLSSKDSKSCDNMQDTAKLNFLEAQENVINRENEISRAAVLDVSDNSKAYENGGKVNVGLENEMGQDDSHKNNILVNSTLEFEKNENLEISIPEKHEEIGILSRIVLAFSVRINTNEIKDPRETTRIPEVNAIFVLSHWWLMFTICCIGTALYSENFLKFIDWLNTIFAQAILNWNIAFDSLLFASAISLAYATFEELNKKKVVNWIFWAKFYIHKIYRMLPTYAAILFFVTFVAEYLIRGPFQYIVEDEARICYENWWANLLYFNNLYPFPGNTTDMCMFWSWFLSLVMQYYLISPILIYTLYKKPIVGFGLVFLCFSICFGCTAGISSYYGLTASQFQPRHNDRADHNPGGEYVLNKPYTRMSPYLVGIVVAFALFKFKNNDEIKIPKIVDLFCWAVSITLGCLVVYGLFGTYHGEPLPQVWNVLYITFAPFAWAIALGWVTFSAAAGYSPFIRKFMRWSLWTMLGRMTYVVQIFYPVTFLVLYVFNRETLDHLQVYPILYIFGGNLALTYTYSYLICLLIEYPLIQLEELFFRDFYLSKLRGIW